MGTELDEEIFEANIRNIFFNSGEPGMLATPS
jgi:hypothetical protein